MRKLNYFMTVRNTKTGNQWEEPLNSIWVNEDSPHADRYEIGMHTAPKRLSEEQVEHYAQNIIEYYNNTLRPGDSPREYLSSRVEKVLP